MSDTEFGPTCPSCGTPFLEHLGLIGTCKKLKDTEKEKEELEECLTKMIKVFDQDGITRVQSNTIVGARLLLGTWHTS